MRTKADILENGTDKYTGVLYTADCYKDGSGDRSSVESTASVAMDEWAKHYGQYLMQRWVAALQMPVIPMTEEQSEKLYETFLQSQSTNH